MAENYIYEADPLKPHKDATSLYTLRSGDTLTFNYKYAGDEIHFFNSYFGPFVTLGSNNVVTVNVFLRGLAGVDAGIMSNPRTITKNNHIIVNASVEGDNGIVLKGSGNTVTNRGDILGKNGNGLSIDGNSFTVTNERLISGIDGIGLDLSGDNGSVVSQGDLGLRGLIHGDEVAMKLTGSNNKADFGERGRLITDWDSRDGSADTDGVGDGLLLNGSNNEVHLHKVIAGNKGVSVSGDGNYLSLNGAIIAKRGIELKGNQNSFISTGNIESRDTAILIHGNEFNVHNTGDIVSRGIAVDIVGDYGHFEQFLGKISGTRTLVSLNGSNNRVHSHESESTGGTAFIVDGLNNYLSLWKIDAADRAVSMAGVGNHLEFLGEINAATEAAFIVGSSNRITVGTSSNVSSGIALNVTGDSNSVANSGTISAVDKAVWMKGQSNRVINNWGIEGNTGILAEGDLAVIKNNGTIEGNTGILADGDGTLIENYGSITGHTGVRFMGDDVVFKSIGSSRITASSDAILVAGNRANIQNGADVTRGAVRIHGDQANFFGTGKIIGSDVALEVIGSNATLSNIGDMSGASNAVRIVGYDNSFTSMYGNIQSGAGSAIVVRGNSNEVLLSPFTQVFGGNADAPAIVMEGDDNFLRSTHITSDGTAILLKGTFAELEHAGLIDSRIGIALEGSAAVIGSVTNSYIRADETAIQATGHQNKLNLKGGIFSEAGDAIVVTGNINEVVIGSLGTVSAGVADGTSDEEPGFDDEAAGPVSAIVMEGVESRLRNEGAIAASGIGVWIKGDEARVENLGSIKGHVGLLLEGSDAVVTSAEGSSLHGDKTALGILGHRNILNLDGKISSANSDVIVIAGDGNDLVIGAHGEISSGDTIEIPEEPVPTIEGPITTAGRGVVADGLGNRVRNDGNIAVKATGVWMKGYEGVFENTGKIRGQIGLYFEGDGGRLANGERGSISGLETAVRINGSHNGVNLRGTLSSDTGDALIIEKNYNIVEVGSVTSKSDSAIAVDGIFNEISLFGSAESLKSTAIDMWGDNNEITIKEGASAVGAKSAIEIAGNAVIVSNEGYLGLSSSTKDLAVILFKSHAKEIFITNTGLIDAGDNQYAIYQPNTAKPPVPEDEGLPSEGFVANRGVIKGAIKFGSGDETFTNEGRIISTRTSGSDIKYDVDLGDGNDIYRETETAMTSGIKVFGGDGRDRFFGGDSDNIFFGGEGSDILMGGRGNDTLCGGMYMNTLDGGEGADVYVFEIDPSDDNVLSYDMVEFIQNEDMFHLSGSAFKFLKADSSGHVLESQICNSPGSVTADHRLIYNRATGELAYDPDGSGREFGATIFAKITTDTLPLSLMSSDFLLI
ncbi:hypothetical protein MHY87_10270 [Microvirga sp. ACRRW]|uniref:hypothetical protein n=1 Tax=Microvirga sp. ACRRW TaxID=2918205 RepID=UPI001EF72982|nr:hypothetical protein [Microvirga sp. ACRRW]MCG7393290.1 hypothetical protein [Microvirga sp. ACRRW]